MVLKIFSDCCICFAFLAAGPGRIGVHPLLIAVICGIAAGIATFFYQKGWKYLRILCAALPFTCLLLLSEGDSLLFALIPAGYTAAMILRGKLELEYYTYRNFFLYSLALLGAAYLIVCIWLFLALVVNEAQPNIASGMILRYGLIHLLCGVVLQRQLRLGIGNRSSGGRNQLLVLLGVAVIIVAGFFLTEQLLREGAAAVMKYLLTLLFTPILFFVEIASRIVSLFEKRQEAEPVTDATAEVSGDGALPLPGGNGAPGVTESVEKADPSGILWALLVVLFLVVAAIILYRSFRKGRSEADHGGKAGKVLSPAKKKNTSPLSNRARIRQYYRDFLRTERGLGMKLRSCDTSGSILKRIHADTDQTSADALRQVYLKARYDDRQPANRSQVSRARQALKGMRRR